MNDLKNKIELMLSGETKRREVAEKFLAELAKMLVPLMPEMYGISGDEYAAIWLRTENGKTEAEAQDLYFRFEEHSTISGNQTEYPGFYSIENGCYLCWGKEITELKGKNFWWAVRTIVEWLPALQKNIEEKQMSRNALCEKLKKMLDAIQ